MWASWNRNGGKNPTDATAYPWINNQFVMVDASGVRVSRPLKSFFSALALGYDYDSFIPKPPAAPTSTTSTQLAKAGALVRRIAASTSEAQLESATPVKVSLRRLADVARTAVLGLDPARRTYLVLRNLHTWKQPEVLYHVYLTPANGGAPNRAHYVGNINFFDAEFHDHGAGSGLDTALGENFYSFDVTDVLRGFARKGVATEDALTAVFVPAGRPTAGSRPMVATIELVTQ